jgi:hypothetical protein
MSDLRSEIALIKKNAKKLAQLYQSAILERDNLQEENMRLKADAEERAKKLAEFENNSINLHISETLKGSTTNKTALKKKLDFFIKEIDACIEHLKG